MRMRLITFIICLSPMLFSCDMKGEKKHKKEKNDKEEKNAESSNSVTVPYNNTSIDCDTSYWKYVYNPERLEVINKCKTVTGTIEESNADEDGDQHMLLKLDNGEEDLINKKNDKKKQGDLVIEAVCANKVMLDKVGNTCNGYINKIHIPNVGDRVKVTGSYVIDSHNGWAEIHPITKIEIIH